MAVGLRGGARTHPRTRNRQGQARGNGGGGGGPWRQSAQETKAKRRKPKDRGAVRGARAAGARPREGVGCWAQHPQPVPRPERQRGRGGQGSPKIQRAEKAGGQGRPWAGPADLPAAELAAQGRFRSPAAEDAMAPAPMPAPSTPTPTCGNTSYGRSPGRARGGPGAARRSPHGGSRGGRRYVQHNIGDEQRLARPTCSQTAGGSVYSASAGAVERSLCHGRRPHEQAGQTH